MADAALGLALGYAKERHSMGQPIIEHQAVGFRLAELATRNEAARQLVLHATSKTGEDCMLEASTCKLFVSTVAEEVVPGAL
jgi:alkylation response protein AidB-like acyl-CoA dehydrogenase